MPDSQTKHDNRHRIESKIRDESFGKSKNVAVQNSRIYLVTIAASLPAVTIGTCFSWSSPIAPKLLSQDTSDSPLGRPITMSEIAWISSIFTIGALITSVISGPCSDKMGRKKVLLFSSIFFILGYLLMVFAREVWALLAARLILGFGSGFALCVIPLYVGEIATDQTRAATVSFMPFFMSFGVCYGYCIGPFVSYMVLQYCCLLVPIIFDIVFSFMPESPYYSVANGQRAAASMALQYLRGQNAENVETELILIENLVNSKAEKAGISEIIKTPSGRKALLIFLGLTFFQQVSGQSIVVFYAQTMFESANIKLDAAIAAILVGIVQFMAAGLAPIVVNKFGRKIILLHSAVFMSISLSALGYFFFAQIVFGNTSGMSWLPVAALIIFTVAFMLGFGPVPWAVLNEMFPPHTKSVAATINTTVNWLIGFLLALFYPALDALGTYYAFWMFAAFCVLAFFFVLLIVVETKDLSFAEVQKKLNKNL